jgi:hypothetical protein
LYNICTTFESRSTNYYLKANRIGYLTKIPQIQKNGLKITKKAFLEYKKAFKIGNQAKPDPD